MKFVDNDDDDELAYTKHHDEIP